MNGFININKCVGLLVIPEVNVYLILSSSSSSSSSSSGGGSSSSLVVVTNTPITQLVM